MYVEAPRKLWWGLLHISHGLSSQLFLSRASVKVYESKQMVGYLLSNVLVVECST